MDAENYEVMRTTRAEIQGSKKSGVFKFPDGSVEIYQNGKRHREDGPAILAADGSSYWYQDDLLHREDGPAIEEADGDRGWYKQGKLHREDGPAMIIGGKERYFIDGEEIWVV